MFVTIYDKASYSIQLDWSPFLTVHEDMNEKQFFRIRLLFTGLITIAIWSLLIWDHFHGGIPSHHILHRTDMPEISNVWGGLILPLLTWFLLYRIQKRIIWQNEGNVVSKSFLTSILIAFAGALIFGIMLSVFFMTGFEEVTSYMILSLFPFALIFPIYRAEFLLGFILGMTYTFGVLLPAGFGFVLIIIFAGIYHSIRWIFHQIGSHILGLRKSS